MFLGFLSDHGHPQTDADPMPNREKRLWDFDVFHDLAWDRRRVLKTNN